MATHQTGEREYPPIQPLAVTWSEVFRQCEEEIERHKTEFVAQLEKAYPVGTEISFWFTLCARNCTIGTVLGHESDGRVRVELHTVNRRGHRTIKRVPWRLIS